jgi:vancomycin resistance protein YoaR
MRLFKITIGALLIGAVACALGMPPDDREMGSYSTSLHTRTRAQRDNAARAAKALDGVRIEPGREISFNKTVGQWTPDQGYELAPVSYDGELVLDWGGGVCQASSALYNAALVAGLEVVERHRHTWAPTYVPPGRDAAVAQFNIDLRIRNPYAWPVRIETIIGDESLGFRVLGADAGPMATIECEPTATVEPVEVVRVDTNLDAGERRQLTRGRPGARVAVYRTFMRGERKGTRELISRDSYPAMNRVVRAGPRSPAVP